MECREHGFLSYKWCLQLSRISGKTPRAKYFYELLMLAFLGHLNSNFDTSEIPSKIPANGELDWSKIVNEGMNVI